MRAKPGQGRVTLQGLVATIAADLGHELRRFYAKGSRVFESRCRRCMAMAIVDQAQWEQDGKGFGGSATRSVCTGKMTCDNCGRAFDREDLHVPDPPGDMRFCGACCGELVPQRRAVSA